MLVQCRIILFLPEFSLGLSYIYNKYSGNFDDAEAELKIFDYSPKLCFFYYWLITKKYVFFVKNWNLGQLLSTMLTVYQNF